MGVNALFHQLGPFFNAGALVGAPKLYHYIAGTSTLLDAWTDRAKSTTAAQPIVGDARGIVSAYFDGLYKLVVKDSADVTLYTWDNVDLTEAADISVSTVTATGTTTARTLADRFVDTLNGLDEGLVGDGSTVNTTNFLLALALANSTGKELFLPDGTYMTDVLDIAYSVRIRMSTNATIKLINSATLSGTLLAPLILRASNSSVIGGTIDANRAGQDKAAFNAAGGSSVRSYYGVYVFGTVGSRLTNITLNTRVKNAMDFGAYVQYADDSEFDIRCDTSGSGVGINTVRRSVIHNITVSNSDNDDAVIYPHAIDINFCEDLTGGNLRVTNQTGYDTAAGNSKSDWFSGITFVGGTRLNLSNISAVTIIDSNMTKSVGISMISLQHSILTGVQCYNYGTLLEFGGCDNVTVSGIDLDGGYQLTTALWPLVLGIGIIIHNNGFYSDFIGRALAPTRNCRVIGGSVRRCIAGGMSWTNASGITIVDVDSIGNRDGVNLQTYDNNDNFSQAIVPVCTDNTFIRCRFMYNERIGFQYLGGISLRLIDCNLSNNGQCMTVAVPGTLRGGGALHSAGTFGYYSANSVTVVDRTRTRLINCVTEDNQTVTTKRGSVNPSTPTVVSCWDPGLYHVGQTIKLVGCGVASADLLAQVRSIDRDEITVDTALSTFPLVAGTGTISTSGTAVTGSGTAFLTEIEGRTWIKNGTNYRLVIKVTSNTVATLESAFPSNLSGQALDLVLFDAQQIRCQETGVYGASSAADATTVFVNHDFGVGNLTGNVNLVGTYTASIAQWDLPKVFVPSDFELTNGTPVIAYNSDSTIKGWLFDDAATERIQTFCVTPVGLTGVFRVKILYTQPNTNNAGNVRLQFATFHAVNGGTVAGSPTIVTATSTAPAQNLLETKDMGTVTLTESSLLRFSVGRIGGDGADTLTGDIMIVAVTIGV